MAKRNDEYQSPWPNLSEKDRAAALFMRRIHVRIAAAAMQRKRETKMTKRDLALLAGIDGDELFRILTGRGNPTIRVVSDLAWALGFVPIFTMKSKEQIADAKSRMVCPGCGQEVKG